PVDIAHEPLLHAPEAGGSSIDLADVPLPGEGSPSEINLQQTENLPALSGEGVLAAEDPTHMMGAAGDDESAINLEEVAPEKPSSGRDIAELVESGIDLEKPGRTEPSGDYFDAEEEDSAVALGAPGTEEEEVPALESGVHPGQPERAAAEAPAD